MDTKESEVKESEVKETIDKLTYNTHEVAEALGVSPWLIYNLCKSKEIPHRKIGRRLVFSKNKIKEWVDQGVDLEAEASGQGMLIR